MTADMKNVMKFQSRDLLNGLASSGIGLANFGGVSMFFLFLLAMIPILWLVIALSVLKMPGHKACFLAWVLTALLSMSAGNFRQGIWQRQRWKVC